MPFNQGKYSYLINNLFIQQKCCIVIGFMIIIHCAKGDRSDLLPSTDAVATLFYLTQYFLHKKEKYMY